ncbi:MAG: hypothetical protein R2939_01360 [Kofleriaceae bacterium]
MINPARALLVIAALALAGAGDAEPIQPGEPPPRELPTWREGPPLRLPPTPTGRHAAPRDNRPLVVGGGALVLIGLYLYNRKAKAARAADDTAPSVDPEVPADDRPDPDR